MGPISIGIAPSDRSLHRMFLSLNQHVEIHRQCSPCGRRQKRLLLVHLFLLEQKCGFVVIFNNVVDDAPSRVRCVEEASCSSAMVDHIVPIHLFQDGLSFISIIIHEVGLIPHCGSEDDILCTFGTSEFSEREEIPVGCCGHPRIGDSLDIHNP